MTPEQGAQSGVMKASFAIINKKLQANATKLHRRNHSATPETAKTDENNNRDNDRERSKAARETDNDATIQDRS